MMKSCSLARSCQFPDKPIPTKNKTDRPSAGATPWVTQTCGVFLCPAGGTQNCMKTGGKSPYFSPVGGANEAAHILSLMGGRAAIQGRKPNGQLGAIEYTILEQPRPPEPKPEKPERENPVLDNPEQASPVLEEPEQENPAQLNTNRSSKEKTKKRSIKYGRIQSCPINPPNPQGSDRKGRDRMRERERYRWHGGGSMQIQCWRSPRCSRRRTPEASHPSCLDCRYKSMAAFSVDLIGCVFVTAISAPISPVSPPYRPDKQGPRRSSYWRSG